MNPIKVVFEDLKQTMKEVSWWEKIGLWLIIFMGSLGSIIILVGFIGSLFK